MKIVHVCQSDCQGGAARATYRLHQGLLDLGVDSRLFVQHQGTDDARVQRFGEPFPGLRAAAQRRLDQMTIRAFGLRTRGMFSPCWVPGLVGSSLRRASPDVIHLHWLGSGLMSLLEVPRLGAPVVWTMHDQWLFTGGCHYALDCRRFERECGRCPMLGGRTRFDPSSLGLILRKKVLAAPNVRAFVAISRWQQREARRSAVLRDRTVERISDCLDTRVFRPLPREAARALWGIPTSERVILFGAEASTEDPRKGYRLLLEALARLPEAICEAPLRLLVFGSRHAPVPQHLPTTFAGHLRDDRSLVSLYSAADVMVVPSLQEAFGLTALEATACGTPVVGFADTGVADIVEHMRTGYLADEHSAKALAEAMRWVLSRDESERTQLSGRAADLAQSFDQRAVASAFVELYRRCLDRVSL